MHWSAIGSDYYHTSSTGPIHIDDNLYNLLSPYDPIVFMRGSFVPFLYARVFTTMACQWLPVSCCLAISVSMSLIIISSSRRAVVAAVAAQGAVVVVVVVVVPNGLVGGLARKHYIIFIRIVSGLWRTTLAWELFEYTSLFGNGRWEHEENATRRIGTIKTIRTIGTIKLRRSYRKSNVSHSWACTPLVDASMRVCVYALHSRVCVRIRNVLRVVFCGRIQGAWSFLNQGIISHDWHRVP